MLTTPGGRSAWRQTSAKRSAESGRRGRRLEDDRVAGRERRGDLPGEHQQREVPRDDLRGDAERPRDPARERVFELVRPARVVPEMSRRERHVDVAALLDRLARVHRFEDGELAAPLLQDAGDPEQVLGAFLARERAPRAGLGAARGTDRAVGVGRTALGDVGDRLLGGRVDGREGGAVLRRHEAAADEQPVALLDRDDVARFGRRRVLPRDRLPVAEPPARRCLIGCWDDARRGVGGHARHYGTGAARDPAGARRSVSSGTARSGRTARSSGCAGGRRGRRTTSSGPRG